MSLMGGSSSIEQQGQPVRGGPSHEPSPPDAAQARSQRAALKNSQNLKRGESRQLKAAALGMLCLAVLSSCLRPTHVACSTLVLTW